MKFAPVSWLASKNESLWGSGRPRPFTLALNRSSPQAFPDRSSGPRLCPRLQLRGSAGFAPASLSSPSEEDAQTYFTKASRMYMPSPIHVKQLWNYPTFSVFKAVAIMTIMVIMDILEGAHEQPPMEHRRS